MVYKACSLDMQKQPHCKGPHCRLVLEAVVVDKVGLRIRLPANISGLA